MRTRTMSRRLGFTIVELLIVIVVIGILAALVLNAFSGVQAKARDTKRQTDVRAISSQLEAWFNGGGNGTYPSELASNGNPLTDSYATTNWPGFDVNAFRGPNQAANSMIVPTALTAAGVPTPAETSAGLGAGNNYMYIPYTGTTGSSEVLCTSAVTNCSHYQLVYWSENTSAAVVKQSLN